MWNRIVRTHARRYILQQCRQTGRLPPLSLFSHPLSHPLALTCGIFALVDGSIVRHLLIRRRVRQRFVSLGLIRYQLLLELLLLLEEHAEADDGPVDQQAADDAHGHGRGVDEVRVRQDGGEGYRFFPCG